MVSACPQRLVMRLGDRADHLRRGGATEERTASTVREEAAYFDRVVQADVERAPQEQQRAFEPRRGA